MAPERESNPMTLEDIFLAAAEKDTPAQRAAYLDSACGGDTALRAQVEALLRAHAQAGSLLEQPLFHSAPPGAGGSPTPERPGTTVGPYTLLAPLGQGGMGTVWLAEQREPVQRQVALKVIKPGMDSRQVIARFEAERQALALMDHPHIAHVFDAGATASGRPYFVMELVKGVPLTSYCDEQRLSVRQRLELFVSVCQAVQHAHQKGIIHRDLKPSNILVALCDGQPVPKVIDFGVAKATGPTLTGATSLTEVGSVVGTLEYMSPEQAQLDSLDIDTRSDIYALGVLLYELLTGTTPLERQRLKETSLLEVLRVIREEEPPRPSARLATTEDLPAIASRRNVESKKLSGLMRGELDWIVMKCLEKDRGRRYETANALALDLQRYLHDEPVLACPPSRWYRFGKFARRHKAALGTGAAVALAVLTVAVVASVAALWLNEEQQATQQQLEKTQRAEGQANHNYAQAEAQRTIAQQLARALSEQLLRMRMATGIRHLEDGDLLAALPWLTAAFKGDQDNPHRARIHRTRLAAVLRQAPQLVQLVSHAAPVNTVEFHPDGHSLVTASRDRTARVWRVETGEAVTPPLRHQDWVATAFFSPDGRLVVTASHDRTAGLWDAQTGRLRFLLQHDSALHYACFCPRGERVVTACADGTARVWDAQTGTAVTPPLLHRCQVNQATFSPDGKHVLTACRVFHHPNKHNGEAGVWDAASGARVVTLAPGEGVSQAWFTPDGRKVVTASSSGHAKVWEVATGKPLVTLVGSGPPEYVALSPGGRLVLTANQYGRARAWETATGKPAGPELKHATSILAGRFSTKFRLATAAGDGTARVWEPWQGTEMKAPLHHAAAVSWVAFSRTGALLATAGKNGLVLVWDIERAEGMTLATRGAKVPAREAFPERAGELSGRCVSFSPDGRWLLAAGARGPTYLHHLATSETHRLERWPQGLKPPYSLYATFSPQGDRVLVSYLDGTARVWDTATGKAVTGPLKHATGVLPGEFSPNGRLVVTACRAGLVQVWEAATGQAVCPPLQRGGVNHVAFHPDGRRVVVCSGREALVWDTTKGTVVVLPHHDGVGWAAFSRDGSRVATACSDGTGRLWDTARGREVTEPLQHSAMVLRVAFSPDGKRLVTASQDATARVWDAATGQATTPPLRHGARVQSAVFSPDGRLVLTASHDATARVWDAATGEPVTPPLPQNVRLDVAAFRPDGRQLVTTVSLIRLWDLSAEERPLEDLVRLSQLLSGRRFDAEGHLHHLTAREYEENWRVLRANTK
ncbi:MAG: protein kinase [Gemmataceae bacterium]|nr:protein kinase [Gemmataceae bacterium]